MAHGEVRQRKVRGKEREGEGEEWERSGASDAVSGSTALKPSRAVEKKIEAGTYWLTRIAFIRALGLIYCNSQRMQSGYHSPCVHVSLVVAFLIALNQNKELLGKNGLLPIPAYLSRLRTHFQVHTHYTLHATLVSYIYCGVLYIGPS